MCKKRYKKNHFIGIGIAIGLFLSMIIAIIIDNYPLAYLIGYPIGGLIGWFIEKRLNPNPIMPTIKERETRKKDLTYLLIVLSVIFFIGVLFYLCALLN